MGNNLFKMEKRMVDTLQRMVFSVHTALYMPSTCGDQGKAEGGAYFVI